MSQQDLDMLAGAYDAFFGGRREEALAMIDPDIVVEVHTDRPDTSSDVYRGHEGFMANFEAMTDVFDEFTSLPEQMQDGEGRVLVTVRVTGRGRGSGVTIDARVFHVWTVADGLATRLEVHSDCAQALRSFGAT